MQVASITRIPVGALPAVPVAPSTAPTVEQLRLELQDPFAFIAGAGCPWPGGKPPKG